MINHDCPWVGRCRCAEDGALCTCAHQHSVHGDAPLDYDGPCTQCACARFESTHPRHEAGRQGPLDEMTHLAGPGFWLV